MKFFLEKNNDSFLLKNAEDLILKPYQIYTEDTQIEIICNHSEIKFFKGKINSNFLFVDSFRFKQKEKNNLKVVIFNSENKDNIIKANTILGELYTVYDKPIEDYDKLYPDRIYKDENIIAFGDSKKVINIERVSNKDVNAIRINLKCDEQA